MSHHYEKKKRANNGRGYLSLALLTVQGIQMSDVSCETITTAEGNLGTKEALLSEYTIWINQYTDATKKIVFLPCSCFSLWDTNIK